MDKSTRCTMRLMFFILLTIFQNIKLSKSRSFQEPMPKLLPNVYYAHYFTIFQNKHGCMATTYMDQFTTMFWHTPRIQTSEANAHVNILLRFCFLGYYEPHALSHIWIRFMASYCLYSSR